MSAIALICILCVKYNGCTMPSQGVKNISYPKTSWTRHFRIGNPTPLLARLTGDPSIVWDLYNSTAASRNESVQKSFVRFALRNLPRGDSLNLPSYESRWLEWRRRCKSGNGGGNGLRQSSKPNCCWNAKKMIELITVFDHSSETMTSHDTLIVRLGESYLHIEVAHCKYSPFNVTWQHLEVVQRS